MNGVTAIRELAPEEAAEQIYAAHRHETAWLDAFAECLDRRRSGQSLARTLEVWGLSQAEVARLFGVSRQAVGQMAASRGPSGTRAGRLGSRCRYRPPLAISPARPNPRGRAQAHPGA